SAFGENARADAAVAVARIPVVALLARLNDSVAAARQYAGGGAFRSAPVPLVALFVTDVNEPITAIGRKARRAVVRVVGVPVIALLEAASVDEPVAAGSDLAGVDAVVGVVRVSVVALLDARMGEAISAKRKLAGARTVIGIVRVSIVAFLD